LRVNIQVLRKKLKASNVHNHTQLGKVFEKYLNNASPTGFESPGQQIWLDYIKPYIDDWDVDHYGTAYGIINPGKDYKVVIEGHADEISWFVHYISDNGFINVVRNGGSDHMIAPSKRVNIHTKKGIVKGSSAGRLSIPATVKMRSWLPKSITSSLM
jgi:putative aminopeptidase FrvX